MALLDWRLVWSVLSFPQWVVLVVLVLTLILASGLGLMFCNFLFVAAGLYVSFFGFQDLQVLGRVLPLAVGLWIGSCYRLCGCSLSSIAVCGLLKWQLFHFIQIFSALTGAKRRTVCRHVSSSAESHLLTHLAYFPSYLANIH